MAKKTKTSIPAGIMHPSSRYASPPVTLRAGNFLFFVPEVLLQTLLDLPRSDSDCTTIELPDLDAETGHIIAHFLHTGEYQLLPAPTDSAEDAPTAATHFKTAIATFAAAKKYGLTALQQLALAEAIQSANAISVVQAAHAIGKDTLTALQQDAAWLSDVVLRKAEQAFERDDAIFSNPDFYDGIQSLELARLVAHCVTRLYRERVQRLSLLTGTPCEDSAVAGSCSGEIVGQIGQQEAEQTSADSACEVVEETACEVAEETTCEVAEETLPDVDQGVAATATHSEPGLLPTEEHGVPDVVTEIRAEPERETEESHVIERPATSEERELYAPSPAITPTTSDPTPPEGKITLMAQFVARTDPFEGLPKKKGKGTKKSLKAAKKANTKQPPVDEAPSAPVEQGGDSNHIAPTAPAAKIPSTYPFAGLSKLQKKKIEKKMKDEAVARDKQEQAMATQPHETEPAPHPALIEEAAILSDLIEPHPNPAVDIPVPPTCALRVQHLAQDEEWRDCKNCELYMRGIAVEMHAAKLREVDGLVTE